VLSSAILLLVQEPAVLRQIEAEPQLRSAFLEECLRLHPPEDLIPRETTADVTLGGRMIPAGSVLRLCLSAANRDPARFVDPDRLDLNRPNRGDHLSFGAGAHHCLGVQLARIEVTAALDAFLRLMPNFKPQPPGAVRYLPSVYARGLARLMIASR
jgi:cytochrome P450